MLFGILAVLNRKLRAAVKTAKAHNAPVLNPNRVLIPHLNRLHGAFLCTQSAADATFLNTEIRCAPNLFVIDWFSNLFGDKCRSA